MKRDLAREGAQARTAKQAKRAKHAEGPGAEPSRRYKGADPATPSLDRLVDSPRQFLVGFHTDGAIFVADAYGTKSKVGLLGCCAAPTWLLPLGGSGGKIMRFVLCLCFLLLDSKPAALCFMEAACGHLLALASCPPPLTLRRFPAAPPWLQQYPRLRFKLGQTNLSLLLACQKYIGTQRIASVVPHGTKNCGMHHDGHEEHHLIVSDSPASRPYRDFGIRDHQGGWAVDAQQGW